MTPDELTQLGEAFNEALGREYYLTGAGLKAEPEFQAIYDRFPALLDDDAIEAARAANEPAVLEWIVDLRVGRAVAALEERQLIWEQQTVLHVDGRDVPYLRAPIELQNSPDRAFRAALDKARSETGAAGLNGTRRDRLTLEHEITATLTGEPNYVQGVATLSGMDLAGLGAQADALLGDTHDLYAEGLARVARRRLGTAHDLLRADAARAFRVDAFDAAFPSDALVATAERNMSAMGLDARCAGRVRFDTEERPAKQPRAFCAPVRVPHEVYLVLRPRGGHADYRTFWHELGHAMHFGSVDPERPFHARWLGDNSVTEGFAMLWDHLTILPRWLERFTDLASGPREELTFELAVGELYMLRRYAAKLLYELGLHQDGFDGMSAVYASRLTEATGFRYPENDYLLDLDPGFYAARYLRAWQFEAALAAELRERFDADWYRNPRAGAFIQHLMSRGQGEPATVLARDVLGTTLDFEPARRRLEETLA